MTYSTPAEQKDRAIIVDIIRGFALTGVLLANFTGYVDQQTPEHILNSISSDLDKYIIAFNSIFLEWKFMTLFSILFGYGFGLILESLAQKNINPDFFFAKRMFWLLIFGAIHSLFWWGDVLNLYAMSGILLLFFKNRSNRIILCFALMFMFPIPVYISYLLRNQPEIFTDADISALYNQYKQGTLIEVFKFNIHFYYRMFIVSGRNLYDIIETLGRFLFGYFLLRIRFFHLAETKKSIFKKITFYTAPIVIGYFILKWFLIHRNIPINHYVVSSLLSIGVFCTTTFYVSILVTAYLSFGLNKFFEALQALGRMTLTNYFMISAFLITLLYGFSLNKLGELPMRTVWLYAVVCLLFEIWFSRYWLKNFRYGPAEWIWRQLTYWKRLPLRK